MQDGLVPFVLLRVVLEADEKLALLIAYLEAIVGVPF